MRIKMGGLLILFLLLISTVCAEGTSTILDNDQTTALSGSALVMCSLAVAIVAAFIIIKIIISSQGGN